MNASRLAPGLRALRAVSKPTPTPLTVLARRTPTPTLHAPAPSRPITTTRPLLNRRPPASKASPRGDPPPPNPQVDAPTIMIAEPGRGLTGPHKTTRVLRSLDRTTHALRVVAPGSDGVPVCRVIDLREEAAVHASRKEREKEREKKRLRYKIVEINWAIARNDFEMKMERMRKFIQDGCRVELVLLRRRGAKKVDERECREVLGWVREAIAGVEGAGEARAADGVLGKTMRLFVEREEKGKAGGKKGEEKKAEEKGEERAEEQEGTS